ncbi:MAG: DUF2306 domain-containing protein [Planctomycetaceae bacterium]|nr:DUF2306 domain-containing protein [Planctomycetaceae bacterium]
MNSTDSQRTTLRLWNALQIVGMLLVLKVTISVLWNYRHYLPPDFESEFLQGREHYFRGSYGWAFFLHIASGPVALLAGLLLVMDSFRQLHPNWHRWLGKFHVLNVCLIVAPSGLLMAGYAEGGKPAVSGFSALALLTGISAAAGWRMAVLRQFDRHRQWMWRCYLLLCSAVTLRLIGGLSLLLKLDPAWTYPLAAWLSWLGPLAIFEFRMRWKSRNGTRQDTTLWAVDRTGQQMPD